MSKLIEMYELMSVDDLERLCEISEDKAELLQDQFRALGKRLAELPMLINQMKQLLEVDRDILRIQRQKLIECKENLVDDCTLEFVVLALERDMNMRSKTIDRSRESLKAFQTEYDEKAVIYSDVNKDMDALKMLITLMEQAVSQKTKIPTSGKGGDLVRQNNIYSIA